MVDNNFPLNGRYVNTPEMEKDQVANRIHIEFYCQECDHYTYVWLNLNLEGNHVMNCPNCNHKHYRVVRKGIITTDRFAENLPEKHEIVAMKSACVPSSKRRHKGEIAKLREMEAAGICK